MCHWQKTAISQLGVCKLVFKMTWILGILALFFATPPRRYRHLLSCRHGNRWCHLWLCLATLAMLLLSSYPLWHPPLCRPLLLSSRRAVPRCVAQCRHRTTLHWRDPPPRAAFCATIMLTVPPLVDATLLPLKDKIWIWQNEFYLQIK